MSSLRSIPRSVLTLAFCVAVLPAALCAQAPHPLTAAEKQRVDSIVGRMTLEQKLDYIGGTGFAVRAVPELGLPAFEMSDGPVGVRSNAGLPSGTYAGGIGLAASWDRDLASRVGGAIGRDARARGIHYMLGPGTNIYRSPHNGRNFEYFGEDPFLASEMVVGYITGMQQQGVSATVKHFLGNNSEFLRHDSDSIIEERALREIYLPAFEAAVTRAHVGSIMDSYNLINGKHATENARFNIDIARREWGFDGVMMSDWTSTYDAVAAANGGLDLEMPTGRFMNRANLMPAIQSGKVTQATIDDKVRHILDTAMMFGWLDRGPDGQRDLSISLDDADDNAVALQSARESAVLLKNDGNLLPLDRGMVKTILLVGPDAFPGTPVGGGSAGVVPFHNISLLEGLTTVSPNVKVLYDPGLPTLGELADHTNFMTAEQGGKPGLIHEVFDNIDFTGTPQHFETQHINNSGLGRGALPDPLRDMMRQGPASAQGSGPGGRGSRVNSAHRYTGFYKAATPGDYLIALAGPGENNGNRVFIDGKQVIDNWEILRAFEPHVTQHLDAGVHKIVVEAWGGGIFGSRLRFAIAPVDTLVSKRALAMAARADAVVIAAGYFSNAELESEGEGADRTFDLPYGQDELIRSLAAANPHTVVTLTSGGNVNSAAWIDRVPALVEGWYGGQAGGRAVAEILFGDINPGGHLPATFEHRAEDNPTFGSYYPEARLDTKTESGNPIRADRVVYKEGIFVGYRGYEQNNTQPLFPFGYGLSYTTFAFGHLKLTHGKEPNTLQAAFDVTNTGKRRGATVAQVYVTDNHAPVPRPKHELKGFERVELNPGETRHVTVSLNSRAFAYYDVAKAAWTIPPDTFTVSAGDSVANLPLKDDISLNSSAR